MATRAELEKWLALTAEISQDMSDDTSRDEGLPFTGKNVARSLGEIRATVVALAELLGEIIADTPPHL